MKLYDAINTSLATLWKQKLHKNRKEQNVSIFYIYTRIKIMKKTLLCKQVVGRIVRRTPPQRGSTPW